MLEERGPLELREAGRGCTPLCLVLCSLRVSGTLVPVGQSAPLCELGNKLYLPIPSWPRALQSGYFNSYLANWWGASILYVRNFLNGTHHPWTGTVLHPHPQLTCKVSRIYEVQRNIRVLVFSLGESDHITCCLPFLPVGII